MTEPERCVSCFNRTTRSRTRKGKGGITKEFSVKAARGDGIPSDVEPLILFVEKYCMSCKNNYDRQEWDILRDKQSKAANKRNIWYGEHPDLIRPLYPPWRDVVAPAPPPAPPVDNVAVVLVPYQYDEEDNDNDEPQLPQDDPVEVVSPPPSPPSIDMALAVLALDDDKQPAPSQPSSFELETPSPTPTDDFSMALVPVLSRDTAVTYQGPAIEMCGNLSTDEICVVANRLPPPGQGFVMGDLEVNTNYMMGTKYPLHDTRRSHLGFGEVFPPTILAKLANKYARICIPLPNRGLVCAQSDGAFDPTVDWKAERLAGRFFSPEQGIYLYMIEWKGDWKLGKFTLEPVDTVLQLWHLHEVWKYDRVCDERDDLVRKLVLEHLPGSLEFRGKSYGEKGPPICKSYPKKKAPAIRSAPPQVTKQRAKRRRFEETASTPD